MPYYCNPVNVNYRYQFFTEYINRESADPSMICFKGRYYVFASMTLGVWVSDDLVHWENHRLPKMLPLYDYALDARVMGEYVYLCYSNNDVNCNFYRTRDVLNGPYEVIEGSFPFWDPDQFMDDDGRVYFYWGCSNVTPIWGVEMDPETMHPIGEKTVLLSGDITKHGFERIGEDHCDPSGAPYIEGPWMTKHNGKYYLQYAFPGTEFNGYGDGVYVSDKPLGPFTMAQNNPFSYSPGSFLPGAGHGSTMEDRDGNWWHIATMRISRNHLFERRVGLWPIGWDEDGEMFCDQRYADWPRSTEAALWQKPDWFLLSYNATVRASSAYPGKSAELAVDENVQTWWKAASNEPGQWLEVDLGEIQDVHAIQINFADDKIGIPVPGEMKLGRYIEEADTVTRWKLEGSVDGQEYFVIEDKSDVETDLSHDLVVREDGLQARYIKLTVMEVPYQQAPCISGLRVFGIGQDAVPEAPKYSAERISPLDMVVRIEEDEAVGHNILWGHEKNKLYHSYLTYKKEQRIGALVKGQSYYVRVDAFSKNGITEGPVQYVEA